MRSYQIHETETMKKHVLLDVDGVILNWNDKFDKHMLDMGVRVVKGGEEFYSLAKRYGIAEKDIFTIVSEFNSSSEVSKLEPLKDVTKYLPKLKNHGFSFTLITSLSDHPDAHGYRTSNLDDIFGENFFDELICLPVHSSKQHVLERWAGSKFFWVEDHFKNAEAGEEVGLQPILIDQPYNSHYHTDLFPRVSKETPWEEIYDIITKFYGIYDND